MKHLYAHILFLHLSGNSSSAGDKTKSFVTIKCGCEMLTTHLDMFQVT